MKDSKYTHVLKYYVDGDFFGYHLDSFCSITQDIQNAKRYKPTESQKEIIFSNLRSTIEEKLIKSWDGIVIDQVTAEFEKVINPFPQKVALNLRLGDKTIKIR